MWKFQGPKQLKAWLTQHPEGRQLLSEIMNEARMDGMILAISHSDRVDLYGYGPVRVRQYVAIESHSPAAEVLAEQIVEAECKKPLYPHAPFGQWGKIGTVTQERLTIGEYEWRQAYRENLTMLQEIQDGETKEG